MTTEIRVVEQEKSKVQETNQEIDQIRNLLFGEFESANEEKLQAIQQKLDKIEKLNDERYQELTNLLADFQSENKIRHKASMVQLGEAIVALGHHIAEIGRDLEKAAINDKQSGE